MPRRRRHIAKAAALLTLCLAAPAAAQDAAPATGGTSASLDGGLVVRPAALFERTLRIAGTAREEDAGRTVSIELQQPDGTWRQIATTQVEAGGGYVARWRTDAMGRFALRAVVQHDGGEPTAYAASAPQSRVSIFEPAVASWYGPGFYGRRTACRVRLTRRTIGVAHRSLPCGSNVEIYHRGRTIMAPVIDRGPFVRGRQWDLTSATAKALGMTQTSRVGVLPAVAG